MLALATTRATVTGRAASTGRDAHGAPKPGKAEPRGPFLAHRTPNTTVLTDAGTEVRGCQWALEAAAWPVVKGEVVSDDRDGSRWTVEGAQLVPTGLGLDHVQADCTQLHPEGA